MSHSAEGAPKSRGGKPSNPRRRAREFVVQGLYQHFVGQQDEAAIETQAEGVAGFDKADGELYRSLLRESLAEETMLRDLVTPYIDRTWEEVSPIERSILLLGACELRLHPETPYRVIINEAIELAKTFGGTDGHKFVNGVLDKLAPTLRTAEIQAR
ncbi:Transcription antitermination protein NusB [Rhodocyclaceae bacterium]|nr:Transcription antitermination protein NusB [Rhodocyclaceae bacterium]